MGWLLETTDPCPSAGIKKGLTNGFATWWLSVAHLGGEYCKEQLQRAQGQVPLAGALKREVKPETEQSPSVSYP